MSGREGGPRVTEAEALAALRGHFQSLARLSGLPVDGQLRLAAALLTDCLTNSRVAGASPAKLDEVVREGEDLALDNPLDLAASRASFPPLSGLLDSRPDEAPVVDDDEAPARGGVAAVILGAPEDVPPSTAPVLLGLSDDVAPPRAAPVILGPPEDVARPPAGAVILGPPEDVAPPAHAAVILGPVEDAQRPASPPSLGLFAGDELLENLLDDEPAPAAVELSDADFGHLVADDDGDPEPAGAVREHRRFVSKEKVVVELLGRKELQELYTRDISKGGLFVATEDPPPLGSRLKITLQTPDGSLELSAEVVHVMAADVASQMNMEAGVGLQFDKLSDDMQQALDSYLMGLAERLAQPEAADLSGPSATARDLLRNAEANRLYEALGVTPLATLDDVEARAAAIRAEFQDVMEAASESEQTRFKNALRVLDRLVNAMQDESRRLAYDFKNGFVRAEERLHEFEVAGRPANELRHIWRKVFPDKAARAHQLFEEAVAAEKARRFDRCEICGKEAIEQDPFSPQLREHLERWQRLGTVFGFMKTGTFTAARWPSYLEENGLLMAEMRELWVGEFPDRVEQAKELGQKAMQAETIKRLDLAMQSAREALELDPFNVALRNTLSRWESG